MSSNIQSHADSQTLNKIWMFCKLSSLFKNKYTTNVKKKDVKVLNYFKIKTKK